MEIEGYESLEMDFKSLMSCIQCHEDSGNSDVVLETLKTISDICSNESCGRDAFREEGGLDFLMEFLFTTDNTIFLEHTIKTLAFVVDGNVHSQMFISKRSVFEVIQTILRKQSFPIAVHKNVLVLIATIFYQNSTAQTLAFEVGLLKDLLNAYERYAQALFISSSCVTSSSDGFTYDLWTNTNSALCFAVNNPQNVTNQETCRIIFPLLLRILEFSSDTLIIGPISSLLSLIISNNDKCQDHFSACDGFLVVKRCFQKYYEALQLDMKICNNIVGKGTFQAINNLIAIISSASLNHKENAAVTGKLGILTMMINLLFVEMLDCQLKTKIVLSLGHCIDACCSNKSYVLETENFDAFLKNNLQLKDAELSSACKYLLQVCLINTGSSETNQGFREETNFTEITSEKKIWNSESHFHYLDARSLLNKEVAKNFSLKRNSVKSFTGRSSNFKFKNKPTKNSERKPAQISDSSESSPELLRKKRKLSLSSQRQLNGSTYTKNEHLTSANIFKKDQSPKKLLTKSTTNSGHSVHSCGNEHTSRWKPLKKEANRTISSCGFNNQGLIPSRLPFTDFLTNDDKNSTGLFLNNSESFNPSGCSPTASDRLPSGWNRHKECKLRDDKANIQNQPFPSPFKMSNSTENQRTSKQSALKMQLPKYNSMKENVPKLFKKKKCTLFPKKPRNLSASSSSDYTFTPPDDEENSNDSGFEFISLNSFAENSFISDRANSDSHNKGVPKPPKRKCIRSSSSSACKCNSHSEFKLNLPSTKCEDDVSKSNRFPRYSKDYFKMDSNRQINEEGSTALTKNANIPPNQTQELLRRDSFSEQVSKICESSATLNGFDEFGFSSSQTFVPETFSAWKENFESRKRSGSTSSTADSYQSILNSSLNSSELMQVIVLPLKTCEQHGLSATAEMLEVVSLEELMKN